MAIRNDLKQIATEPLQDPTNPEAVKRSVDQLRQLVLNMQSGSTTNSTVVTSPYVTVDYRIRVKAVARANVALTGVPAAASFDDVTIAAGDPVFVSNNALSTENGTYLVVAGAWTRIVLTAGSNASGANVVVNQGTLWANTRWSCTSLIGADVVGTNNLTWVRDSELLPDIPFDADDLFAHFYDEDRDTAMASSSNAVPGGTAQVLTAYQAAAATSLPAGYVTRGPFGKTAVFLPQNSYGFATAASAIAIPVQWTLSFWLHWSYLGSTASSAMCVIGRSNTNAITAAGYSAEWDAWLATASSSTIGAGTDAYRYYTVNNKHGGGTDVIAVNSAAPYGTMTVRQWNHVSIRYGNNYFILAINGVTIEGIAGSNNVGTAAGKWAVGNPGIVPNPLRGSTFGIRGVRFSKRYWTDALVKEQAERGLAWV